MLRQSADQLGLDLSARQILDILRDSGAAVFDGDDEDDNVVNSQRAYSRIDVAAAVQYLLTNPTGSSGGGGGSGSGFASGAGGLDIQAHSLPTGGALPDDGTSEDWALVHPSRSTSSRDDRWRQSPFAQNGMLDGNMADVLNQSIIADYAQGETVLAAIQPAFDEQHYVRILRPRHDDDFLSLQPVADQQVEETDGLFGDDQVLGELLNQTIS